MGYDPCAPRSPVAPIVKAGHAPHRHPVHHLLGRRIARSHGIGTAADACPKIGRPLPARRLITRVLDPLASPGILTVAAMGVVGATAFSGLTIMGPAGAPGTVQQSGTGSGKTAATGGTPSNGTGGQGSGTPGTAVPEPGTAALLAVAMVVVLISSWVQGRRALRARAQSDIASGPLPNRRVIRAARPDASHTGPDRRA